MKPVFSSDVGIEVEQVASMLRGAGFDAVVIGSQTQSTAILTGIVESRVEVADEDFDDAIAFLEKSKIELDAPRANAALVEGNVCPVHEKPAIATCERCGTFLCADCGALGDPPNCEQCVARPASENRKSARDRFYGASWSDGWFWKLLAALVFWALWYFGNRR